MTKIIAGIKKFGRDEDGATMIEYGLMLAFIAIVCVVAVAAVGTGAKGIFSSVAGTL